MPVVDEAHEQERLAALDVEHARVELAALAAQIEQSKADLDALYERRRILFRVLLDGGEKQAVIARMAGVTPMVVAFAVGKGKAS